MISIFFEPLFFPRFIIVRPAASSAFLFSHDLLLQEVSESEHASTEGPGADRVEERIVDRNRAEGEGSFAILRDIVAGLWMRDQLQPTRGVRGGLLAKFSRLKFRSKEKIN